MAKKKRATNKKTAGDDGKARIEVRMERTVHAEVAKLAAQAGLSTNQLIAGAMEWLVQRGHTGEPYITEEQGQRVVRHTLDKGVVWFGKPAQITEAGGSDENGVPHSDEQGEPVIDEPGIVYGVLDYRSVVRYVE